MAEAVSCPIILNLLRQYLFYSVGQGGNFYTPRKGISRGFALSPLMAGFQLFCIDHYFAQQKYMRYQRYMDNFLILCKTRWQCRLAAKQLNQFFHRFGFKQHSDKTFIGKVAKGFDWLGYQFNQTGVIKASLVLLQISRTNAASFMSKPGASLSQRKRWNSRWQNMLPAGNVGLPAGLEKMSRYV